MTKILVYIPTLKSKNKDELNFFKINGKPLSIIKYLELKKSRYFDNFHIIIGTDNIKYSSICMNYNIQLPFLIPKIIMNDKIKMINYVMDWLRNNSEEKYNFFMYLPSNSLFLNVDTIDNIIETFLKNKNHYDILQTYENINVNKLKNIYHIKKNNCIKINLKIEENKKYCILTDTLNIYKIKIPSMITNFSKNILPYKLISNLKIDNEKDFTNNYNLIKKYYHTSEKIIKIKVLGNNHKNTSIGYFGFEAEILDKYMKSKNWTEPTSFSCYRNDSNKNFDVVIWRKKIDLICTAHGRHKDKNKKVKFNIGEELFLKYNDMKIYKLIEKYKNKNIFSGNIIKIFKNKRIIICGNGNTGYEKNKSNKYIDGHDIVIRVNSYKMIPNICGEKTTFHFMNSLNTNFHTNTDPIFPEYNKCDYILINDDPKYHQNLRKLKNIKKPIVKYNTKLIDEIMFEIFNSKIRMTGSIIMILMIMVRMNVKCEINYIGFSDGHKLVNNSQQYYWGNRKINNNKNTNLHNSHQFDKQYKILNILDYLL